MGIKIGIDLGTTYSAVGWIPPGQTEPVLFQNPDDENNSALFPSVVQFLENGEVIVGTEAKESMEAGEYGCAAVFKRQMGIAGSYCSFYGVDHDPEELSGILLAYLKKAAEEGAKKYGLSDEEAEVEKAVVTVPAYFYDKERRATMRAAQYANLTIHMIINEPTAAAMNYTSNHWSENAKIMVYDLGGGTFDITLIEMGKNGHMRSIGTLGDHKLGGKDWDEKLQNILKSRIYAETGFDSAQDQDFLHTISQKAERIKRQLTSRMEVKVSLVIPGYGKYETSVTREEFEMASLDLIQQTGALCQNLLNKQGMTWEDVNDILLVGGSTRMPQVAAYLHSISGHIPLSKVHPDEAVALGASIQVNLSRPKYVGLDMEDDAEDNKKGHGIFKFGKKKNLPTTSKPVGIEHTISALELCPEDVVAHAMGIIAVNPEGTNYVNKTIIPENQVIPVKKAQAFHFYTSDEGDNPLDIFVLQGTKPPLESQIVGRYVVKDIRHDPNHNPTLIRVQYSYDANAIVHVQARQENDTVDLRVEQAPLPEDMQKYGLPIEQDERAKKKCGSLSVVLVVDVSGSMTLKNDGSPLMAIEDAKNAMREFVNQLSMSGGDTKIGIAVVSDRAEFVQHLTSSSADCKRAISSVNVGMTGGGNAAHPFTIIQDEMRGRKGRKIGIVLADGVWSNQSGAVEAAKACHRNGIDIVGIGFGAADKKFLNDISNGDIKSAFVSQSELVKSFGSMAQVIGNSQNGQKDDMPFYTKTWEAPDEL